MTHRLGRGLALVASLGFVGQAWRGPCFALLGVMVGLGVLVAQLSRATSYLSDAPETCVNCHVMTTSYLSWQHSSHRAVAHCNDCHVPHTGFLAHWGFKARDGLRHATVFTLRREPQVIRLSAAAVPVVEANCRRCHEAALSQGALADHRPGDPRCWECHREVPHGRVRGQSAVLPVLRPPLPPLQLWPLSPSPSTPPSPQT